MPSKTLITLVLAIAALLPLHAQQSTDRVAGRVVSSLDQRPIAHATVTLQDTRTSAKPLTTTAGEEGEFSFPAVPPGKYRLSGSAPGYLAQPYQNHDGFFTAIVTGAGVGTDALVLEIDPTSSISGHVFDEAGDPVRFAQLALYSEQAGHTNRVRNAASDTAGEYSFDRLAPGTYFLTVSATPWYAVHPRADQPQETPPYRVSVEPGLDVAYPLTFYPHALDSAGASPFVLKGGNQVSADMQLSPRPAMAISLHAPSGNLNGQRFPALTQSVFGNDEAVQLQTTENSNGMMRFPGLAPGLYKIREFTADGHFQTGSEVVDLTTGPVSMDFRGRVEFATVSLNIHAANGEPLPAHLQLTFRRPAVNDFVQGVPIDKNPADIPSVPSGTYRLDFSGGGHQWNVVTLAVAGKSVPDKLLRVPESGGVPVDITISSSTASLEGFVRRDGKPVGGSMVVLVPAGGDTSADLYRRDQSNLDGGFTFSRVVPGNYLVVAIDDAWSMRWNDPTTLIPYLMHAVPISVPVNSAATIRLPEAVAAQAR